MIDLEWVIYGRMLVMLDCRNMPELSRERSRQRLDRASRVLGEKVVSKLVALALYLLGAKLERLGEFSGIRVETLKALFKRSLVDGLPALEDRRRRSSTFLPQVSPAGTVKAKLVVKQETLVVQLDDEVQIETRHQNPIQCRAVLLTMLDSGLLTLDEVATGLGLSTERVRKLRTKLLEGDVEALIDQRRGRQRDLLMTPEVKGEVIQQYVLNLHTGTSTSSRQLTEDLADRCHIDLAERTIRLHVGKLGLRQIRSSLPALLEAVKKTPEPAGKGKSPARSDQE
jgi:hypothetical protein